MSPWSILRWLWQHLVCCDPVKQQSNPCSYIHIACLSLVWIRILTPAYASNKVPCQYDPLSNNRRNIFTRWWIRIVSERYIGTGGYRHDIESVCWELMGQQCFVFHNCNLYHHRGSLHLRCLSSVSRTWSQEIHSWWKVAQRMYLVIWLVTMSKKEELLSNDNIHMSIQCIYSPRHHISLHLCQFLFSLAPYCQLNTGSQDTGLAEICNEQI